MKKTGKEKILEQFLADDICYMFGNPGTVEQGFLDALTNYPKLRYITCLQESIAVAAADGYARKTKNPALVQLHSGVGLGNGIGMLYQAYRGHSPLIVIAGEAGIKYDNMDAQMACDLVEMAKPVTKYAVRVTHHNSVLRVIRRAVKMAMTPPMGPVFVALPLDILEEENAEEVLPSLKISCGGEPEKEPMTEIAEALAKAENPVILAGDGVNEADAVEELEDCAALLAAKVYGVNNSCINISQTSPWYQGDLGHMFGTNSHTRVKDADAVLMVGTYAFPEVFPSLENPFKPGARIFHIDLNTYEIAKNHPVTIGIQGHPKAALQCLNILLKEQEPNQRERRKEEILREKEQAAQTAAEYEKESPVIKAFFQKLQEYNDDSLILFDEALTASSHVFRYLPKEKDGTWFQTRGGSLGVGIPGAIGIQLADPGKRVLTFTGDGGSMYTIQALYTAVRYHLPIKIVICKNNSYGLLMDNIRQYWKENQIPPHSYPECFQLFGTEVDIDFIGLANSMGVEAKSVRGWEEAASAAAQMMESQGPFLIELNTKIETF